MPKTPAEALPTAGPAGARRVGIRRALVLGALAILPFVPMLWQGAGFLADPLSELPVKLWVAHTFPSVGLFGGVVEGIGFPYPGALNNPDVLLTIWFATVGRLLGDVWGWNTFVAAQLFVTMWAATALAREVSGDEEGSWTAGVAIGFAPMVLVYCVAGAVSDMLSLWPYPLAALYLLRAIRGAGPAKNAALAGLFVSLGFVTCPYNLVVFLIWLPLLVLAAPVLFVGTGRREGWKTAARRLGIVIGAGALVVGVVAGAYALQLRSIMDGGLSQMSSTLVDSTRHTPPFPFLEPLHPGRYVAVLTDLVNTGKSELIVRDNGSRYYRAYSPGFLLMALALWGLVRGPRRLASLFWIGTACVAAAASLGPFATVDGLVVPRDPNNPIYLMAYYGLAGILLLEPFRYVIAASLALGIAAALGAARLPRVVRWILPLLVVAEVAVVSPVPVPLPSARLDVPEVYRRLDDLLPPGAILELPYSDQGTTLFVRTQLYWQTIHHRRIPNEVAGFTPRWLKNNAFTAGLLSIEGVDGPMAVRPPIKEEVPEARREFSRTGFVGVVVDPARYRDEDRFEQIKNMLTGFYGDPVATGERWVWKVP